MPIAIVRHGPGFLEKSVEPVRGDVSRLSWAWDGLCFAVPFNDATRDSARDMVVNAAPSVVSGLAWTKDNRGNPAALLGATSYIDYPDNPAHNKPSTQITAYVRLRRAGTPDSSGGVAGKRTSTGTFLSWAFYDSDTRPQAMQAYLSVGGAAYSIRYDAYLIPDTEWTSFFLRWTSGATARFDILGERGTVIGSATSDSVLTGIIPYSAGEPIRINASDITTQNYYGAYSQVMLWSRVLTDAEIQALVADPFGWYAPRRETVVTAGVYPIVPGAGEMRMTGIGGGGMM